MRTILLTLTLLAASGCLSKVHLNTQAQKGPSLAEKGVTHIAGELLDTFIEVRVVRVFNGCVSYIRHGDNSEWQLISRHNGLATAISKKGYFLTAAHCVDNDNSISIVPLSGDVYNNSKAARIVWSSVKHDIALIHIDAELETFFDITSDPQMNFSTVVLGGFNGGPSAGHILSTKTMATEGGVIYMIDNTCPSVPGDSGAPLLSVDGQLVGIHQGGQYALRGFSIKRRSRALAIDVNMLKEIIHEDITSRSTRTGKS